MRQKSVSILTFHACYILLADSPFLWCWQSIYLILDQSYTTSKVNHAPNKYVLITERSVWHAEGDTASSGVPGIHTHVTQTQSSFLSPLPPSHEILQI